MGRIKIDYDTQFNSKYFQEVIYVHGVKISLAAPDHQEINVQNEEKWQTLRTIAHSIMVHAHVSGEYINFALMYNNDHIFTVITIKHFVNQDGEPTMSHLLETGTKPSVSNPRVLFFPCVVQKATAHVDTKALNMRHQSQKCFSGIFVGITQHHKWYLINIPSTRKLVYSHDVVFDQNNLVR